MTNQLSKGEVRAGAIQLGTAAGFVRGFITGSVSVDPASIATVTRAGTAVTVTGAEVGDTVIANPPATLEAGLLFVGAEVTAADEVTVYLYNHTGGAVDGAAISWVITVLKH